MRNQNTIQRPVKVEGIGLHTGAPSCMWLEPAPVDHGILFHHGETGTVIPAQVDHAQELSFATRIGLGESAISTVEHLLSALRGLNIDNVFIHLDGGEVPIVDGSAEPFVELIENAGIREQERSVMTLRLTRPIEVRDGEKWIRAEPSNGLEVDYRISFDNPLVGFQRYVGSISPESYRKEIAPARTFGFLKDVKYLKSQGLGLGGSFSNCVIVDDHRVISGELRFPDEFVRHKVLDLIGDLALLEYPIQASVTAHKAGHALHAALVRAILANPESWELVGDRSQAVLTVPQALEMEMPTAMAL